MLRSLLILLLPLLVLLAGSVRAEETAPPAEGSAAEAAAAEGTADADAAAEEEKRKAALDKAYAAEQQLASELQSKIKGSEVITLRITEAEQEREILALYQPQTRGEAEGALLLLHDMNNHPDWPGVIASLRRGLPEAGWHTLSLQLPRRIPEQETVAWLDTSRLRIADALAELDGRGIKNVVVIGHGLGASAAIDYLSENLAPAVQGLVVIGLDGRSNDERRLDAARGLGLLELPVLDIYGGRDRATVLNSAKRRYDLARRSNNDEVEPRPAYADIARDYTEKKGLKMSYRQIKVSGADHHFTGQSANLIKRLRGWLKRYAAGTEIK
jgi:pimeloyl-ACP methyl ester carboxylesterase